MGFLRMAVSNQGTHHTAVVDYFGMAFVFQDPYKGNKEDGEPQAEVDVARSQVVSVVGNGITQTTAKTHVVGPCKATVLDKADTV